MTPAPESTARAADALAAAPVPDAAVSPDAAAPARRSRAWLFFSLLAIVLWGVWGVVSKAAGNNLPAPADLHLQVISTLGVVPIALLLIASPNFRKHPGSVGRGVFFGFLTGLCGSIGNLAFFASLDRGGEASTVLPLTSIYPLVTVLLAVVILRERLNLFQVAGMAVALLALYLFNTGGQPTATAPVTGPPVLEKLRTSWMALALVTLVLFGVAAVTQKLATNHISTELSTVCFALAFVPVALAAMAWKPIRWDLTGTGWTLALLTGVLISTGTLTLFAAYRTGKASVVTALTALYPALTVLLAVRMFGEKLDARKIAAIVLALTASVALTYEKPATAASSPSSPLPQAGEG